MRSYNKIKERKRHIIRFAINKTTYIHIQIKILSTELNWLRSEKYVSWINDFPITPLQMLSNAQRHMHMLNYPPTTTKYRIQSSEMRYKTLKLSNRSEICDIKITILIMRSCDRRDLKANVVQEKPRIWRKLNKWKEIHVEVNKKRKHECYLE